MSEDVVCAEDKLRSAAEEGNAVAQLALADTHFSNARMTYDFSVNLKWMGKKTGRKAPGRVSMLAKHLIETIDQYATNDLTRAYKWYTLSILHDESKNHSKIARLRRDELANHMTAEQIKEAENQVQNWLAQRAKTK